MYLLSHLNRASKLFWRAPALLGFASLILVFCLFAGEPSGTTRRDSTDRSLVLRQLDFRQPRPTLHLVADSKNEKAAPVEAEPVVKTSVPNANGPQSDKTKSDKTKSDKTKSDEDTKSAVPEKTAKGKFDDEISFDDFDLDEDASIEPSASDWENAELVPTPVAVPEIIAEVVPTPLGIPERAFAEIRSARKPPIAARTRSDVLAVIPPHVGGLKVTPVGNPTNPLKDLSANPGRPTATENEMATAPSSSPEDSTPEASTPEDNAPEDNAPRIAAKPVDVQGSAAADVNNAMKLKPVDQPSASAAVTGPIDFKSWKRPNVTLFVTGQQHGYIEPCGCTGLDRQKGGVARRMTFATQLRDEGWELMPIDAGNLIRRFGRQAEIKFHRSLEALRTMGYVAVGFGPDDVRISVGDLIQEAAAEKPEDMIYASANVVLVDPSLMPSHQVVQRGGIKVAITSILDPKSLQAQLSPDIILGDPVDSAKAVLEQIQSENPDYTVLTYYGEDADAKELVRQVDGFDLVVVAGGYGEPTYQPESIEGSSTKMILTGNKGMYAGLVGLYEDDSMKYARVPLTHEFEDAPEMRKLMSEYQYQLRDLGLENLGLKPIPHPSGGKFVGSKACGECHTNAFDIWEGSAHFEATEHLVHPGERGDVPRHFDPECISCHVTGWNPQNYYPYETGYLDLETHKHLHGNGCENCHGPGAAHAAAESGDDSVSDEVRDQLRRSMQLPLEKAREKCMECHDLDNSPDFHEEDAFDDYWAEVEHYGMD